MKIKVCERFGPSVLAVESRELLPDPSVVDAYVERRFPVTADPRAKTLLATCELRISAVNRLLEARLEEADVVAAALVRTRTAEAVRDHLCGNAGKPRVAHAALTVSFACAGGFAWTLASLAGVSVGWCALGVVVTSYAILDRNVGRRAGRTWRSHLLFGGRECRVADVLRDAAAPTAAIVATTVAALAGLWPALAYTGEMALLSLGCWASVAGIIAAQVRGNRATASELARNVRVLMHEEGGPIPDDGSWDEDVVRCACLRLLTNEYALTTRSNRLSEEIAELRDYREKVAFQARRLRLRLLTTETGAAPVPVTVSPRLPN